MIEKPKKERRFLKILGKVGEILVQELLIKVGKSLVQKIGGKKTLPSIIFLSLFYNIAFASIDSIPYPITGNKQRLGWQTSGNGLVWRGRSNDTITKPTSYVDKNVKAYLILDSVRGTIFVWRQTYWDSLLVGGGGGGSFTQPVDSLFFDTSVSPNNVDTAKMRWDSDLATVVLGMYDQVPNELGFKSFWLVKNQTGSTITKGSIVYANGTVGASGRITVAKFIANGTIEAKYLLGVTAHDLTDGEDGYVISFGKIRQVNTDTFAAGAILYPSPTVAGVWTDVEPVAPNIDMPIGFCINSSSNNGTIAIRVASGYKLSELHDVAISSPVDKASLYYSGGLWRDTTASLLVSDTASMLANYATKAYADTTGRFYARQDFTNVSSSTLTWTQSDTLIPGGVNVVQVYRNGQILLPSQYTIPTSTSVVIAATSYKAGENYTVIFPRGGGAGSGGGSGSLTSISAGTGITVSPNPITTTGTVSADLSVLMELSDTVSLSNRINLKLNATDTASLSSRINAKGTGTVTSVASGYGITGGTITSTGTLVLDSAVVFSRIRDSIVDVAIGNDTIKILKQEYAPATSSVLTWTVTPKFPIQLKAYILVFRNGQLLINDQYNLTDTNKITIVSNSFKVGANYTVVTVSGIGSVGTGVFPNPVYPDAGIALSTGSTWASSIPNNSSNWNTAYNDKINSLAVTGTTTKTITLTQQDGGTVSGNFTDNGSVTSVDMTVPTGLSISGNPITTNGTLTLSYASGYSLPTDANQNNWTIAYNDKIASLAFTGTSTKTLTLNQTDGGTVSNTFTDLQGIVAADTASMLTPYLRKADTTLLNLTSRFSAKLNISDTASMLTPYFRDADTTSLNLTSRFSAKENTIIAGTTGQYFRGDKTFQTLDKSAVGLANVDNTSDANKPVSTATQTALNLKVNISDTASMLTPYLRKADTTLLNLTSRFASKLNLSDTSNMLLPYLRKADTTLMLSKYLRKADTTLLNLTSRFAAKLNISDTSNMLLPYLRKADTTNMLLPYFRDTDTTLLNLTSRFAAKLNISDTASMLTPYFRDADTTQLNLTSRFAAKLNISDTASMLTPYLRKADTTQLNLTSRFAAKLNLSDTASMLTNYLRSGVAASTYLPLTGGTLTGGLTGTTALFSGNVAIGFPFAYKPFEVKSNSNDFVSVGVNTLGQYQWSGIHFGYREADIVYRKSAIIFQRNEAGPADASGKIHLLNVNSYEGGRNADLRDAKLTIGNNGFVGINDTTPSYTLDVNGTLNATGATTLGSTLAVTGNITENGNNVLTSADTTSMLLPYLRKVDTTNMLSPYFRDADTIQLNLTSRFAAKQNTLSGTGFVKASGTNITYDNSTYLTTGTAASTYLPLTGGTLTGGLTGTSINLSSTINSIGDIFFGSNSPYSGLKTRYFKTTDVSPNRDLFIGSVGTIGTWAGRMHFQTSYDTETPTTAMTINEFGNINMNGTLGVTGNITEAGNNVLTNLDTASLSSRIDSKFNSSGGTISGKAILNDSVRFEGNILFKKNMGLPIVKISNADYTATTSNHTIIYTTLTADKTLTIPNASDAVGVKFVISIFDIPEGNEALTLVTPSSNLFVRTDGESLNVDIVGGYCTTIQSDGTKWYILSYAPMY